MEVGPFIKLHRIEQGITQEDLAEGIISMSYLSKIENQRTTASPEVINMLCTRLGVQLNSEKDALIKQKCKKWYKLLFTVNDKEEIIAAHDEIKKLVGKTHSSSSAMFEIFRVRYFLILGEYNNALSQLNKLSEISSTFDGLHQFFWYKFKGNYSSLHSDFNQAMRMYKLAEEEIGQLEVDEEEVADLQYTIAVTHSKLRNTLEAIEYAEKSLHTFMQHYNFIRCAESHIVLGISYRRIRMYEKAIKNYNLAKHLGELNRNKQIIQLANQNLGYLHSTKGDKRKAIDNYKEVAQDPKIGLIARLAAVTSLTKEYYAIDDIEKTREMLEEGLKLLNKTDKNKTYKFYYYIIYTYKYVLMEDKDNFESLVIDEFIPHLEKHKDYANLAVYNIMLGDHYEKLKRYKVAAHYYKQANKAYEELTNI